MKVNNTGRVNVKNKEKTLLTMSKINITQMNMGTEARIWGKPDIRGFYMSNMLFYQIAGEKTIAVWAQRRETFWREGEREREISTRPVNRR